MFRLEFSHLLYRHSRVQPRDGLVRAEICSSFFFVSKQTLCLSDIRRSLYKPVSGDPPTILTHLPPNSTDDRQVSQCASFPFSVRIRIFFSPFTHFHTAPLTSTTPPNFPHYIFPLPPAAHSQFAQVCEPP
jgi:hypothetical protein